MSDNPYLCWLGQRGYSQGLCESAGSPSRPPEKTNPCMLPSSQVKNLSFHDSLKPALVNPVGSAREA